MRDDQLADRWRRRVQRQAWLRAGVWASVMFAAVWGVGALVSRVIWDVSAGWLLAALPAAVLVWLAAGWWARRQVPSRAQALTLLDRVNRRGGLIMVGDVAGRDAWLARDADRPLQLPAVRWRARPGLGALTVTVLFAAAALLIPIPRPEAAEAALDLGRSFHSLQQQVDVLEEQRIWEKPEAQRARSAMQQLDAQASAQDPAKTWEALDHLRQQVDDRGQEAAELARQRMQEAAAAEAMAQALQDGGDSLEADRLGEAMRALRELSEAAAGEPASGDEALPPDLGRALSEAGLDGAALSPEMLEALAEAMSGRGDQLREMLEALSEAGLDRMAQSSDGEPVAIDPTELLDFLQSEGTCDAEGVLKLCQSRGVGRGGLSRGPGHAEMIWQDPASREGVSFDPELLPPAGHRDPAQSRRLGTSRVDPQAQADAAGSSGGALSSTPAGGGSAEGATILPRHRDAVQRYFDRAAAETP